jgi:hypothetical protein
VGTRVKENSKSVRRFGGSTLREFRERQRATGRGQQTTDEGVRVFEGSTVREFHDSAV